MKKINHGLPHPVADCIEFNCTRNVSSLSALIGSFFVVLTAGITIALLYLCYFDVSEKKGEDALLKTETIHLQAT